MKDKMNKEKKYYTPDYSDIFVGQVLYWHNNLNAMFNLKTWHDLATFVLSNNLYNDNDVGDVYGITLENWRIKYLDSEDIEELGWKRASKKNESKFIYTTDDKHYYKLLRIGGGINVYIRLQYSGGGKYLFWGKIYNKSELSFIMKRLGIL